jgi:hypothetical protein
MRKTRAACASKSNEFWGGSYAPHAYRITLQPRLVGALLFDLVSGGLSRQESRRGAWVSSQFVRDLSAMPEPACGPVDPQRVGRLFQLCLRIDGFASIGHDDSQPSSRKNENAAQAKSYRIQCLRGCFMRVCNVEDYLFVQSQGRRQ